MRMFKLLIVDDEPDVADSLYRIFRNVECIDLDIYKAYSAFEALEILNSVKIDIIMTDIFMPGMNGLKLVEKVKQQWPHCRIIFLTVHNKFDYIYSAIKHEGSTYLLKTESPEKIIESVENAAMQIENSLRLRELEIRAQEHMNTLTPYMQKEYIRGIIAENESLEELCKQFEELKIPLNCEQPVLLLVGKIVNYNKRNSLIERTKMQFKIKEIAEQHFSPFFKTFFLVPERFILLWMIQPGTMSDIVKDCAQTIQNILMDSFDINVSFIVDSEATMWEMVSSKYNSLKLLLHAYMGQGVKVLLLDRKKVAGNVTTNTPIDDNKLKLLFDYLEYGQKKDFLNLFSQITQQLNETKSKNYSLSLEMFYAVSLMFISYINRYGLTEKVSYHIDLNKLTRIDEHASWDDAIIFFKELAEVLFSLRTSDDEKGTLTAINYIKQYISEHISEDLSLARLAEKVYFNPTYLSRLFKQITGTNLINYINEVRLNKAKEMLKNNKIKIHEIAASVGYESASYFTQFFKRALKISPQEYRDKIIHDKLMKKKN